MNTPNTRRFNVAVVGATGAVGEVMLSILAERDFPVGKLVPLASARSAGSTVEFRGEDHVVQDLATFDPSGIDKLLPGPAKEKPAVAARPSSMQDRKSGQGAPRLRSPADRRYHRPIR